MLSDDLAHLPACSEVVASFGFNNRIGKRLDISWWILGEADCFQWGKAAAEFDTERGKQTFNLGGRDFHLA